MDPKEVYMSKPWLKYYPEGVPHQIDVPETTVPDMFDKMADTYSRKVALIFYGKKIHYGKLKELTNRFAAALDGLGVAKGNTVALYLLNSPQYVIAYLGTLKVGAKVTPISPVYTSKEVKHQLEDSEAKTIVCEDILYDNVEKAGVSLNNIILSSIGDYLPPLKRMFGKSALGKAYGEMQVPSPQYIEQAGLHLFKNLIEHYRPREPQVTIDPKTDIAALPYTGGTTGLPKAAVLTHYNMVSLQAQISTLWPFLEEGNEVEIAFLPFFHIYGQVVLMLGGLAQGHTLVLFTTPDIDDILAAVERYKASTFLGVPTLYEYLKEYDKTDRVNWKRLKIIVCGADTLHESTLKDWQTQDRYEDFRRIRYDRNNCCQSHQSL